MGQTIEGQFFDDQPKVKRTAVRWEISYNGRLLGFVAHKGRGQFKIYSPDNRSTGVVETTLEGAERWLYKAYF